MKVVLTEAAQADLESISRHIALDNPVRAASFVSELLDRCEDLQTSPQRFQLVPRYAELGIRRRAHGSYLIFYRVGIASVEVIHIMHGARDYEDILFADRTVTD